MKVGINGFGRIGKNIYRILIANGIEVPLVNDPFIDLEYMAYLLKYDTVTGREECKVEGEYLVYKGRKTKLSREKSPELIKWGESQVDYVVEATGVFKAKEDCSKHACKRVILTAPSRDIEMYVYGVNHEKISGEKVISSASCTTNCLAPLAKIINDAFGIEEGVMSTVHAVTATQRTTDSKGSNWRSSRSAMNIIPASTGAATAVGKVLPELKGKLMGMAFRVPVINGSVVDLTVKLSKPTSLQGIKEEIERAGNKEVIACIEEEVVSADIIGDSRSSLFDLKASIQVSPTFFKLVSWYDNEYAYSCRVVDILKYLSERE